MLTYPTDEHLLRFLAGELEEIERQRTAAAVDQSSEVQQRLESLIDPDETLPLRKGGEPTVLEDVPGLESLIERLCHQPPPTALVAREPQRAVRKTIHFPDPPTPDAPLGKLDSFRIVEQVASGAGGIVFRAVDSQLNRTVAVKVLRAELATNQSAKARFVREAQAASSLNNDHVVTVYQVYDEPSFLPCLIMEYIRGQSLGERLRQDSPVSLQTAARIVREAACGLAAAHKNGLIHRDVKPSNIMLEHESGRAKITDFGLARLVESATRITSSDMVVGTPAYMSPEQIAGSDPVDGRSDVYSLGVVLYELLTGELPFRGNVQQTLTQILDAAPTALRRLNTEIDAGLEAICLKTLAKEPRHRYQSACDLAEDLARWLDGGTVRARPIGVISRLRRGCEQKSALPAVAGALFVAIVAVVSAAAMTFWPTSEEHSQAKLETSPTGRQHVFNGVEFVEQTGALVYRVREGVLEVLLVRSRRDSHWTVPKATQSAEATAWETAAQEAFEEAGVRGVPRPSPIGNYFYERNDKNYRVTVFALQVEEEFSTWPEQFRARIWCTPEKAARFVASDGLRDLARGFNGDDS